MSKYRFIVGPVSMTIHTNKNIGNNQLIYIFGDVHIKASTCFTDVSSKNAVHIADYIKALIENSTVTKQWDIFLEYPFQSPYSVPIGTKPSYLIDVANKFKECLRSNKSKCHSKRARFHYADIRVITPVIHNFLLLFSDLSQDVTSIDYDKMMAAFTNIKDLSFDELMIETKIAKQVDDIPSLDIRNFLWKKADFYLNKFYPDADLYNDFFRNPTEPLREKLYLQMLDFLTYLVDFYILGRMFRSFVINNNIIIYVGEDHADNIRVTLDELGYNVIKKAVSITEGSDFQCLDLFKR